MTRIVSFGILIDDGATTIHVTINDIYLCEMMKIYM